MLHIIIIEDQFDRNSLLNFLGLFEQPLGIDSLLTLRQATHYNHLVLDSAGLDPACWWI